VKKKHDIIKKSEGHDAGYKALLSHPAVVEDLLTFFARADIVRDIDFKTLAPYRENFVARVRTRRTIDVVWQAELKDRGPAYIFILLEPQSRVYRWMPIRVLTYTLLLYQDLIVKKKLKNRDLLPPVLPVVIYRGSGRWKAPMSIETLIESPHQGLAPFIPGFSFMTIEAKHPKKVLIELRSIMAKVFLFETAPLEDINEVVEAFGRMLETIKDEELRNILNSWYENKMEAMQMEAVALNDREARTMFEAKVKRYRSKLIKMGEAKGEARGEAKGEAKERRKDEKERLEEKRESARRLIEKGISREEVMSIIVLSDEEMEGV